MLVELGLVEQRYQAVREVLDHGASVTDVARRNGLQAYSMGFYERGDTVHPLGMGRRTRATVGSLSEVIAVRFPSERRP